jgi:hypothetical protein
MIAAGKTSPTRTLSQIGRLTLLEKLFTEPRSSARGRFRTRHRSVGPSGRAHLAAAATPPAVEAANRLLIIDDSQGRSIGHGAR